MSRLDHLELFKDARADLGEGPWWDGPTGRLLWLDLFEGTIHSFCATDGTEASINVGQPIGVFAVRANGGMLAAVRDGLGFTDFGTGSFDLVVPVEMENTANRANDGACDAKGRFWYGTMAYDQTPNAGTVYRVDRHLNVVPMIHGTTTSNGIDWSPDNALMYHADTGTRQITVWDFDLEAGEIANGRVIYTAPPGLGSPDGLAVDAKGDLWVAMWGGGAVLRLSPNGKIRDTVPVPSTYVTSVVFGGADMAEIYITTARLPLTPQQREHEPHAGSVFRYRPGISGKPQHRFAG